MYYIIADTCFNDEKIAKQRDFENAEAMDNYIIQKWNNVVKPEDCVYVFGVFGVSSRARMTEIFQALNGRIYIICNTRNSWLREEEWKACGAHAVWYLNFTIHMKDQEKDPSLQDLSNIILFPCDDKLYEEDGYKHWCVYGKLMKNKDIPYEFGKLCISANFWDYTPISLNNIVDIYKRMGLFDEMEETDDSRINKLDE